jgi:lipid-binding SYLF domain-containing protein
MKPFVISKNFFVPAFMAILLLLPCSSALAASAEEIDIKVDASLERFQKEINGGKAFLEKAEGVLAFPSVVKAGFFVGGEYGEGALRIKGKTADYYSTAAASFGLQIGAQAKTIIMVFLDKKALEEFRKSDGWEAGVDGSIAMVTVGTGGTIDTNSYKDPIVAFIFNNKGLMANLTLEGAKFTKLER